MGSCFLRVLLTGSIAGVEDEDRIHPNSSKGPFTSSDCDIAVKLLPILIYCFGVILLHQVLATATATNFTVTGESLCDQFGSDVATMSQMHCCHWM